MNTDTTKEGRRVAVNWLESIGSGCDQREVLRKGDMAFGAALMCSALGAAEASRIMFDLDEGLHRIAYDCTERESTMAALRELKAKLEQSHV